MVQDQQADPMRRRKLKRKWKLKRTRKRKRKLKRERKLKRTRKRERERKRMRRRRRLAALRRRRGSGRHDRLWRPSTSREWQTRPFVTIVDVGGVADTTVRGDHRRRRRA